MQKHPRDINLSFESCITGAYWKTFALDHSSRPEQSELMNTAQLIKQRTKSMQNHKKKSKQIQVENAVTCLPLLGQSKRAPKWATATQAAAHQRSTSDRVTNQFAQ